MNAEKSFFLPLPVSKASRGGLKIKQGKKFPAFQNPVTNSVLEQLEKNYDQGSWEDLLPIQVLESSASMRVCQRVSLCTNRCFLQGRLELKHSDSSKWENFRGLSSCVPPLFTLQPDGFAILHRKCAVEVFYWTCSSEEELCIVSLRIYALPDTFSCRTPARSSPTFCKIDVLEFKAKFAAWLFTEGN